MLTEKELRFRREGARRMLVVIPAVIVVLSAIPAGAYIAIDQTGVYAKLAKVALALPVLAATVAPALPPWRRLLPNAELGGDRRLWSVVAILLPCLLSALGLRAVYEASWPFTLATSPALTAAGFLTVRYWAQIRPVVVVVGYVLAIVGIVLWAIFQLFGVAGEMTGSGSLSGPGDLGDAGGGSPDFDVDDGA